MKGNKLFFFLKQLLLIPKIKSHIKPIATANKPIISTNVGSFWRVTIRQNMRIVPHRPRRIINQ